MAVILTLLIEGLLLWAILDLAVQPLGKREGATRLVAFSLEPAAKKAEAAKASPERKTQKPVPRATVPPPIPKAPPPSPNKGFVPMSHADLIAGDIGKLPAPESKAVASAGGAGDTPTMAGSAPGGQPLYRAEWYREPRDGELALYLPKDRPLGSWAVIACKTIEHYHVENCQAMGESPPGSGIARAMRQAAWQFLIRPPRVGSKPLIGAWVGIRFDFVKEKASDGEGD